MEPDLSFRSSLARLLCLRVIAVVAALGACAPGGPEATDAPSGSSSTRIVSLVPSFTETLVRLGAGERVVGMGRYDPEIPGRPDVPRLGDMESVNLESLVALDPDVVLVNSAGQERALAAVAGRVRIERIRSDRLDDALAAIARIAALVGQPRAGEDLLRGIHTALEAARERARTRAAAGVEPPRVLVVVQRRPVYTAGGASYLHDLLEAVGAVNVAGDLDDAWPVLSDEALLARRPDVVLDASIGDVDDAARRAALLDWWAQFETLPAVRAGRVRIVSNDALFRPGPRVPEALELLERLVFAPGGEEPR